MRIFIFFFFYFITTSVFSNTYYPPTQNYNSRSADIIYTDTSEKCKTYKICNHTWTCQQSEWLWSYTNTAGEKTGFTCRSCPEGYNRSNLTLSDGTAYDDTCQKPCEDGYKLLNNVCESCPEIYKEWRIDNPDIGLQCLTKKCSADKTLDTATGQCVDFDPKCSLRSMETIYPITGGKPFCSSFCRTDPTQFVAGTKMQYRSADTTDPTYYECRNYPSCPVNHQLKIEKTYVKTTQYQNVSCEKQCSPDENKINGTCYKKCTPDQEFIDGKCIDTDPIVQAIKNLTESVTNSLSYFSDFLSTKADETNESVLQINSNLDDTLNKLEQNQNDNQHNQTEQPDLTQLKADTPVYTFNLSNFLSINKFNSNEQCPQDKKIIIWSTQYTFKYSTFCSSLEIIGKIILAISIICAYQIIRRDE